MRSGADRWAVTTWNVHGSERPDVERLADVIRGLRPDVAALQEIRCGQARSIARRLGWAHVWTRKHAPAGPLLPHLYEGAALITPHALGDRGRAVISDGANFCSYRRRIAQWSTVRRIDGTAIWVCNVHLASGVDDDDERVRQAHRVAELAAAVVPVGQPIVIAGDLNDHDDDDVRAALPGTTLLPLIPTNPSDAPVKALDHIMFPVGAGDAEQQVPEPSTAWASMSDHLPLTVRFRLE